MSANPKNGPMTEAELEQLDTFLAGQLVPHNGMSLEILDGFLSALVVGPELVMPSEYLPHVWGDAPAAWDLEEATTGTNLVVGLWNHIAWRVHQPIQEEGDLESQAFLMPALALPVGEEGDDAEDQDPLAGVPDDFPFAAGWARGFLLGVSLRGEAWADWLEGRVDFQDDLSMVAALSVIDDQQAREMDLPEEVVMTLEERLQSAVELPGMLHDLNLLRLQGMVRKPIRREATPGRNDPCSCGSGKKFKKCCGAGGQHLH
jgi:uncharacterized protein